MNIFYNILAGIICLVLGYIFGSIPTAVWIGKVFFHQDPRDYGSHNAGGTNAGRLWGKKFGLLVIVLDMFKTIAPFWAAWAFLTFAKIDNGQSLCPSVNAINNLGINNAYLIPWPVYWLIPLGSVIGHCWPMFAKFKGGKGVSVFMGIILFSSWMIGFIPGLIYMLCLKITKYVSLSGIITGIISSLFSWIWVILTATSIVPLDLFWLPMYGQNLIPSFVYAIVVTILAIIMISRHHENIKRLVNHEERKISWMK